MTWPQFRDSIAYVIAVFPTFAPSEETLLSWHVLCEDLDATCFHQAVKEFCQTEPQLYPGTNIVALLRQRVSPGRDHRPSYDQPVSFSDEQRQMMKLRWEQRSDRAR